MNKRFIRIISLAAICCLLFANLCACGKMDTSIQAYDPEPTPEPLSKEETQRIDLEENASDAGYSIFVEGRELMVWNYGDAPSVSAEDLATVPGIGIPESVTGKYIPLSDLTKKYDLGKYSDTQKEQDYYAFTESGVWSYTKNITVPVVCFLGISDHGGEMPNLEMVQYFFENVKTMGFTPVFFEDFSRLNTFDNPIVIVFTCGYDNIYSDVFPLAQQNDVKFSVFQTPDLLGSKGQLNADQVKEMSVSGLVAMECRVLGDEYLIGHSAETQEKLISGAKLELTRVTGKVPCALFWPDGYCTSTKSNDIAGKYFKFGIATTRSGCFNTSDDNMEVPGIFIQGYTAGDALFENIAMKVAEREYQANH